MGLTRKIMSVSTGGAVDFRSDKERIARKTAKGARYEKKSYKLLQEQVKADKAAARLESAREAPPAPPATKGKSGVGKVLGAMSAGANAKFMEKASPEIRAEIESGMVQEVEPDAVAAPEADAEGGSTDLVEGLVRLTALRDSGALSEGQFEAAKDRLLAGE